MVSNDYEAPKDMSDMPKPGEHGNKQEPRKTATIVTTTGGGTYYSADCPHCGKLMPVGKDLSIMFSCCNSCGKLFDLRYHDGPVRHEDISEHRPFNPPPAQPRFPDAPGSNPRRGPLNWQIDR